MPQHATGSVDGDVSRSARTLSSLSHDARADDALRELVKVEWEHARALARERIAVPGSVASVQAHQEASELADSMAELERTLAERPWTET